MISVFRVANLPSKKPVCIKWIGRLVHMLTTRRYIPEDATLITAAVSFSNPI
jgi:hypothetical protein